ncbi:MAG: RNA polymerase sigma factor [Planctomycetota bacterium]
MTRSEVLPLDLLLAEQARFLGFLERRLGDRATAEDVLQDAYVKAWSKGSSLREDEAVVPWFFQVLRNAVVDYVRRRQAGNRARQALKGQAHGGASLEADLHDALCACVGGLLTGLRPEQADLLRRVELEGQRVKDVAEALGIAEGTAAVRLHRARQALGDALKGACGACATHGCRDCQCRGPRRGCSSGV